MKGESRVENHETLERNRLVVEMFLVSCIKITAFDDGFHSIQLKPVFQLVYDNKRY